MFKPHFKKFGSTPFRYTHSPVELEFQSQQVEVDGLVTSSQEVVKVDRSETYKNFKALDFSIQNQLAVGSYASAKPVTLASNDIDGTINSVHELAIQIENEKNATSE